jgi:hypothetical protein
MASIFRPGVDSAIDERSWSSAWFSCAVSTLSRKTQSFSRFVDIVAVRASLQTATRLECTLLMFGRRLSTMQHLPIGGGSKAQGRRQALHGNDATSISFDGRRNTHLPSLSPSPQKLTEPEVLPPLVDGSHRGLGGKRNVATYCGFDCVAHITAMSNQRLCGSCCDMQVLAKWRKDIVAGMSDAELDRCIAMPLHLRRKASVKRSTSWHVSRNPLTNAVFSGIRRGVNAALSTHSSIQEVVLAKPSAMAARRRTISSRNVYLRQKPKLMQSSSARYNLCLFLHI